MKEQREGTILTNILQKDSYSICVLNTTVYLPQQNNCDDHTSIVIQKTIHSYSVFC